MSVRRPAALAALTLALLPALLGLTAAQAQAQAAAPKAAAQAAASRDTPRDTSRDTTVAGVRFDSQAVVAGKTLALNGAGVRYKAIFKVYAAGLYLPTRSQDPQVVLQTREPRRLHIVMLRDIDGRELGKLFTRGMEQNVDRSELSKVIPGMMQMGELFSARRKLAEGENFSVDWVPGEGTKISINGEHVLGPIKEPGFYASLMKIWLGNTPADHVLKDALLGLAAGNGTNP